ncbi:hypothetical protein B0F90DRAFT_1820882 [Multifurca ochricompacta]|uniref:NB-ARC domain-containing protein n=1 Tax=Multifurca ochricompacta TaxID=376703 RepID=A0AAD4LZV0_9AGAM|nr:hypothetical protein B0F90DRAFT_1820882 [Multifurca ochricompacta]
MFHASQRGSQPVPIHSSEPIGGSVDVAMTTIETSLAALKEASSLMSKIPYISPVAGLLLQVLTMRDEVKQNKEEWGVVMRKLGRVAGLVVNVGESCQKYNLEENDLPPGLRSILRSLQNELGGIESLLKQSAEMGHIRKALLRKDLLRKVKQYDGELSNVLQTFQAELALDARFEQIAERRKGIPAGPSGPSNVITSIPQEPRSPQIFFGRDAELAEILHMILTGIRSSRPARIAILGPGGYGKTTLANAALTHPQVQEQFGGARYFVACESVFSSGALLVELAKTLGILDRGSDASWSHIHAVLSTKDSIICLDNFESPWDQAGDTRDSVEELLSRVTALNSVTLLITMRGTMRPGQTLWTKPTLAPLKTFSQDAAREIWKEIEQNYDTAAEELIKAVDYVPLAVSLLAHLAQATSPTLLLKEWKQSQTKFIQMGQTHRLSNLEYSIQLSINSGRMRANPPAKDLLGILSMLPDGIHTSQLGRFKEILVDMDILSNLRTLQQCSLVHVIGERYQTHPIIRHFCNQQEVISSKYKDSLYNFYIDLASSNSSEAQPKYYAEMVLEMNNTKAMLFDLLRSNYGNNSKLVEAIITFTYFHVGIGDHSDKLISQTVESLQQRPSDTSVLIRCLQAWGRLYYYASDFENAKAKLQEVERLCLSSPYNNSSLHAGVLRNLSELYQLEGALNEAEVSCQKALELHKIANNVLGQANDYRGLGDMYLSLSRLDEAEASYREALKFHKIANDVLGQANDHKGLGDIYLDLSRLDEAEASYREALKFHKIANDVLGQANDHSGLGDMYLSLSRLDEAEASYKEALKLHKFANNVLGQANDHSGLGDMYLSLSRLDEAEASYREALKFHKFANDVLGQANDHKGLGDLFLRLNRLDEAEASYKEAMRFHKIANDVLGQANNYRGLGSIYLRQGRLDEAEASYKEALKFHKIANSVLGQANDHKGLGDLFLRQGRLDEAEASYREALKFHKIANSVLGQANDHKGLGDLFLRLNRLDEAEASYKEAMRFHKIANDVLGQANDYRGLGDIYLRQGRLDEAEASYKEALKFHKIANDVLGQANDHKGLGDIYLDLSRLDEAEASYREALKFHKIANNVLGQANDHKGLGDLFLRQGRLDEAEASYKEALKFHKIANSVLGQANDHKGLGDLFLKLNRLDEAEASYKEALKFHKIANDVLGQANDHKDLGTYIWI